MYELNHIDKESYNHLCLIVKENIDDWIDKLIKYDNEIFDNNF